MRGPAPEGDLTAVPHLSGLGFSISSPHFHVGFAPLPLPRPLSPRGKRVQGVGNEVEKGEKEEGNGKEWGKKRDLVVVGEVG